MKNFVVSLLICMPLFVWAQEGHVAQPTNAIPQSATNPSPVPPGAVPPGAVPCVCPKSPCVCARQFFFSSVSEVEGSHGSLFDSTGWERSVDGKSIVWKARTDCNAVFFMLDGSSVVFNPACYNPDESAKALWAALQKVVKGQ
jgi:hypothetical protein